jgi:hypothetical protein
MELTKRVTYAYLLGIFNIGRGATAVQEPSRVRCLEGSTHRCRRIFEPYMFL